MKRFTVISLLLCILCAIQAKDKIIEHPTFIARSSTSLEVDKIIISDTTTVVYIKVFNLPNEWIKIAKGSFLKDNNEQLYPIRRGIGITLDKEFYISESGEAEFQLIFPPIPKSISIIDFSEGDFDGAHKIWGIQLDKKTSSTKFTLPKSVTNTKINPKMTLPKPINLLGKAVLKGKVLDFRKGMPIEAILLLNDVIRGRMVETTIPIKEDGTFYKEVDVFTITPSILLLFEQDAIDCLLSPEKITSITINLREISRKKSKLLESGKPMGKKAYYSGYLAGLQQELLDNNPSFVFRDDNFQQILKDLDGKSPEEYKAYMLNELPEYRKQITQSKHSPAWKKIQNIRLDLNVANIILDTEKVLKEAHVRTRRMERETANNYFFQTKINIPKEYYQYLKEFPSLHSPEVCYSYEFTQLIHSLSRSEENERIIKEGVGTDEGYFFDCIKAMKIGANIQNLKPLKKEQEAQLTKLPESYGKMIGSMNNELLKKLEANKKRTGFIINEAGQVSNENLFASIISKFRGHTLLVDFWATWCSPCKRANNAMLPLKETLKEKDVIYLYITGETSPLETWRNMIPDIHGEHFRVTKEQWQYLNSNFNITRVPTYFIVDREGNITYRETGFSGVDNIKKQLLKALNK